MAGIKSKLPSVSVIAIAIMPMLCQAETLTRNVVVEHEFAVSDQRLWRSIGRFCSIEDWQDLVQDCVIDERIDGIYRTVVMKDSTAFVERLESLSQSEMSFEYSIESGPLSVNNYRAHLQVKALGNTRSKLLWSARYDIRNTEEDITSSLERLFKNGIAGMERIVGAALKTKTGE